MSLIVIGIVVIVEATFFDWTMTVAHTINEQSLHVLLHAVGPDEINLEKQNHFLPTEKK